MASDTFKCDDDDAIYILENDFVLRLGDIACRIGVGSRGLRRLQEGYPVPQAVSRLMGHTESSAIHEFYYHNW